MAYAFKTADDSPYGVEILGAGYVQPYGGAGLSVDLAATSIHELQGADGEALTGKELNEAAKAFAEARGLQVVRVPESEVNPDFGAPDPRAVSRAAYVDQYGDEQVFDLPAVNADAAPIGDKEEKE